MNIFLVLKNTRYGFYSFYREPEDETRRSILKTIATRPEGAVYYSNKHIWLTEMEAQLILIRDMGAKHDTFTGLFYSINPYLHDRDNWLIRKDKTEVKPSVVLTKVPIQNYWWEVVFTHSTIYQFHDEVIARRVAEQIPHMQEPAIREYLHHLNI